LPDDSLRPVSAQPGNPLYCENRLPIFHFSEILALALGAEGYETWFVRHLVDPRPLLPNLAWVAEKTELR
jgi:hypothetical protein